MEIMLKSQKLGVEVTTLASVLFVILVVFPTAMLSSKGQASAIVFGHLFEYLGYNPEKTDDGLSHLWLEGVRCSWMGVSKGKEVKKIGNRVMILA